MTDDALTSFVFDSPDSDMCRQMAMHLLHKRTRRGQPINFHALERFHVYMFGATVLFASCGMGELVYRFLFAEFDGMTDRLPLELLFGMGIAWFATKAVGEMYKERIEISAWLRFIQDRNGQIRNAVEGIAPLAHPSRNQQSIRVIREEAEQIDLALKEISPQ